MKLHPSDFLVAVGAVDNKARITFPDHVYVSATDYKEMKKHLYNQLKKENDFLSSKNIQKAVDFEFLGYGPNENLADVIKPGYVLVDTAAIEKFKNATHSID